MDAAELTKLIQELEDRVERLRALYEQYFMGIERLEPMILRKDVDRRLWQLRREQIRNTATRFKLQTVVQRYNTYQQYWQRIVREIESGTYQRDLGRAAQRFGEAATTALGARRQKMFEKGLARRAERDAARRSSTPPRDGQAGAAPATASPPALPEVHEELAIDEADLLEDAPAPPVAPASLGGRSPPRPAAKLPPRPDTSPPGAQGGSSLRPKAPLPERHPLAPRTSTRPTAAPPPGPLRASRASLAPAAPSATAAPVLLAPVVTYGAARPAGAPRAPVTPGDVGAAARASAAPPGATPRPPPAPPPRPLGAPAPSARPSGAPTSPARPPGAPTSLPAGTPAATRSTALTPRAAAPALPPTPSGVVLAPFASSAAPLPRPAPDPLGPATIPRPAGAAASIPRPAGAAASIPRPFAAGAPTPASSADDAGLSAERLRQIYGAYVDAKREARESTAAITYDKIASNLRDTAKQLRDKHQGKSVDFEVVMKNGRPVLKPVLKG